MIGIFINLWNRLTGGGSAPAPALLDTYGGAAAAFSLRKLSSTYGGSAVRVRRSLDNTEQDIGFSGDNLDETALQAFVGYENLLTYSEEFNNAAWGTSNATITSNSTTAPDGTITADTLIENTVNGIHYVGRSSAITTIGGQTYTFSAYVKQFSGTRNVALNPVATGASGSTKGAIFNLTSGTFVGTTAGGTGSDYTAGDVTIQSVGNGWYRLSVKITVAGSLYYPTISLIDGTSEVYTGNGTSGIYVWGAQLNKGVAPQSYQQTVATANTANGFVTKWYTQDGNGENLLLQSNSFTVSPWNTVIGGTGIAPALTTNAGTDPFGGNTATRVVLNTGVGTTDSDFSSLLQTVSFGTSRNYSIWMKSFSGANQTIGFNVAGGIGTTFTVTSSWQRFSFQYAPSGNRLQLVILGNGGSSTCDVLIYGAQISNGTWLQGYQATTTTAVSRRDASQATAASQPRIVNAGVIERLNGKPAIYHASTQNLGFSSLNLGTSYSFFPIVYFRVFDKEVLGGAANYYGIYITPTLTYHNANATTSSSNASVVGLYPVALSISRSGTTAVTFYDNGNINQMTALGTNTDFIVSNLSGESNATYRLDGHLAEIPIYPTSQSNSILNISQNQNSYYQLFWQGTQQALLDQFGGSAAAFSLRNLSSSYRGPLVRVRRSSDNAETDIGGTFSGDLDVNSLLAFTGGQNLLAYSQEFDNAYWNKFNTSVVANATIAPDGTLTSDKITESATTAQHVVTRIISVSGVHTMSVYLKAAERSIAEINVYINTPPYASYEARVDLLTGDIIALNYSGGVYYSYAATNVGNGWWRVSMSGTLGATANVTFQVSVRTGTLNNPILSYLGVAGSGIYVWGAQLTTGSVLQPYIPTTTAAINGANAFVTKWYTQDANYQNLVLQSQTFDNATWVKGASTISTNTVTAPDGTTTADLMYPASNGTYRGIYQPLALTSNTYTQSIYAKFAGKAFLVFVDFSGATAAAYFNIQTGTIGNVLAGYTANIQSVGDGWYRCLITSTNSVNYLQIAVVDANGIPNVTTNGTDGLYIWGAQVNQGELVPYTATTTAISQRRDAIQTTAASQPRIVNAGSVESENGKPSVAFTGSTQMLSSSGPIGTSVNNTMLTVQKGTLSGAYKVVFSIGPTNAGDGYTHLKNNTDQRMLYMPNSATWSVDGTFTENVEIWSSTSMTNLRKFWANNIAQSITNSNLSITSNLSTITIGNDSTGSSFQGGNIQESLFWPQTQSDTSVLSLNSNINTYYQIYWQGNGTALLDSFSGASAAYSLRNLSSAYTGPLIRVRRSSDNAERDIFGTFRGDLDLAALTSFVGANSGFVTTWYDQSGSGRHATQATAASQPRIVNAGAVDTQNGKPAMVFDGSNDLLQDSTNNPFTFTGPISFIHASYKNSTAYKSYETLFSAGTTGVSNTNASRTIGFGYANNTFANPIPSIVTDIWSPSGVQQNGTVAVNQSRIVGYYISDWSTHRTAGQTSIRSNGVDLSVIPYGLVSPLALNTNPIKIGGYDTILPDGYFAGSIFEMVAYASNQVASRVQIESNINNYYKIY
jgi:hypothetical protein